VLEKCRDLESICKEKELCIKLVIYKNYTEMHGQQNIKFCKQRDRHGGTKNCTVVTFLFVCKTTLYFA